MWQRLKKDRQPGRFVHCYWELDKQQGSSASRRGISAEKHVPMQRVHVHSLLSISTLYRKTGALLFAYFWWVSWVWAFWPNHWLFSESYCWCVANLKRGFQENNCTACSLRKTYRIVGGAGFNEEEYKESESRVKLYFLDGPYFYSEYLVYWFCIKSGQLLLCVTKIHKALLMQG